jgi:hypothetical protein
MPSKLWARAEYNHDLSLSSGTDMSLKARMDSQLGEQEADIVEGHQVNNTSGPRRFISGLVSSALRSKVTHWTSLPLFCLQDT